MKVFILWLIAVACIAQTSNMVFSVERIVATAYFMDGEDVVASTTKDIDKQAYDMIGQRFFRTYESNDLAIAGHSITVGTNELWYDVGLQGSDYAYWDFEITWSTNWVEYVEGTNNPPPAP